MPRPVKCRKVCHFTNVLEFLPADDTEKKTLIVLTVDEYETIRLLDKKGYSQEQCAESIICDGKSSDCSFGGCYKQEIYQKYAVEKCIRRELRPFAAVHRNKRLWDGGNGRPQEQQD